MALPLNNKVIGDLGHTADHNAIVDEINYIKTNYFSASSTNVNIPGYLKNDSASTIYAPLFSASLVGTPFAPTASPTTNNKQIATTEFVRKEITNLIASAPATLDTLNELAAALGNDPNFATSTASAIGQRLIASTASTLYLGINNTANHARTASSINGLAVTGPVASANFALFANTASSIAGVLVTGIVNNASHSSTASSINASLLTGTTLPATIINSSLTSVGTLTNLSVTNVINGRVASANFSVHTLTASSIAGSLVSGPVSNAAHSNTASSINWSGVTGRPTTLSGYGITDAASLNSPNFTGVPTAPTASPGSSTSQIATTEWVNSAILSINSGSFVDLSSYVRKDSASVTSVNHANSASSINWGGITGLAQFPDGTSANPSITNTGDTNTGIFFPEEDTIGFSKGGIEVMRIGSAGQIIIPGGTSASPALTRVSGTTTGIFFPDGAQMAFSTSGIERWRIDSGGTLRSTNNTSFQPQIQIKNTNTDTSAGYFIFQKMPTDNVLIFGDNLGSLIWQGSAIDGVEKTSALIVAAADGPNTASNVPSSIRFSTSAGDTAAPERMRITSNGNVGIGTTTPNRALSVIGSASFTGDVSALTFSGLLLGNAISASSMNWAGVTGRPTTFSGYGLTNDTIDCGGP